MTNANLIKRCIYDTPLALTSLPSNIQIEINNLIPYDTGIEVECSPKQGDITPELIQRAKDIEGLKEVNLSTYEQRFRIPNGIKGLITLYNVSLFLKEHFGLNPDSGNHYHTDLTDVWKTLKESPLPEELKEILLSELDTWEYKGTYNRRQIEFGSKSSWIAFNYLNTMEVRIGEMTFDYKLLVTRILHCQYLNKVLRAYLDNGCTNIGVYIQKLKELNKEREELNLDEVKTIVNNRVIRI